VNDAGKLEIRKDIYGRDAEMIAMLKNGGKGKDMENVIAHAQPSYSRPAGPLPSAVSFASENSSSSAPNFFERLFGGGPPVPPAPIGRRAQQRRIFTR